MIHELYANKNSFKKIQFNKGINIILKSLEMGLEKLH